MVKPAVKSGAPAGEEQAGFVLRLRPVVSITPDQLLELSSLNRDLRMELTAGGELIVMPPAGGDSSDRNAEVTRQLGNWTKQDGNGRVFDSSGGFVLPNGAIRSPDASWVEKSRLNALTPEQRKKFLPLCPDFVVELRSPSDSLRGTQQKVREYIENGARLGWLIDPENKRIHVYSLEGPVRELEAPETLGGDPVLPGFVLDLREVW